MTDWKPEAIEAFKKELDGWSGNFDEALRAALDAAIEAQGCVVFDLTDDSYFHARSYEKGRAEAFEEAAELADKYLGVEDLADSIRALAKEQKG